MKAYLCRMCHGTNLTQWLDLGLSPHSDHFHKEKEAEMFYPLGVSVCNDCGLNQLTYIVAKESLYLEDYLYESSITKTAQDHWQELADTVSKKIGLTDNSFIVDIGSNDGTLLSKFQAMGHKVLGIDPTPEATQLAIDRGIPTIQKFFGEEALKLFPYPNGKISDLVVGTNVFAHVDDLDTFMEDVDKILKPEGVFVFESPYFGEFLKGIEADTVYHQHLSYLSLKPVVKFMGKHEMEVFDVEQRPLHGGVFRVYIARKGQRPIAPSVQETLDGETWTMDDLQLFAQKFRDEMDQLLQLCLDISKQGTIAVVSTPAKGNTLLNYSGIGRFISFATDKSKLKQGRFLPGTQIEVLSDEELIKRQPSYALVLAWNFFPEITENVRKAGFKGRFIRPLPTLEII